MLAKGWRHRILPRLTSPARPTESDSPQAGDQPPGDKSRRDNHLGRGAPVEDSPSGRATLDLPRSGAAPGLAVRQRGLSGLLVARLLRGRQGRLRGRHGTLAIRKAKAVRRPPGVRRPKPGSLHTAFVSDRIHAVRSRFGQSGPDPMHRVTTSPWEQSGQAAVDERSTSGDGGARRPGVWPGPKPPLPSGLHPTRSSSSGISDCSA